MLVDVTELCERGRRYNSFSDEQIDKIVFATSKVTIRFAELTKEKNESVPKTGKLPYVSRY